MSEPLSEPGDRHSKVSDLYRRVWRVCATLMRTEPRYRQFMRVSITQETFEQCVVTRFKVAGIEPLQMIADGSGFELFGYPLVVRASEPGEAPWGARVEIDA